MRRNVKREVFFVVAALLVLLVQGATKYRSLDRSVIGTLPTSSRADRDALANEVETVSSLFDGRVNVETRWVSYEPEIAGGSWDSTVEGLGDPEQILNGIATRVSGSPLEFDKRLGGKFGFDYLVEPKPGGVVSVTIFGPSRSF